MEKFNILDNEVAFDEDFEKYILIYNLRNVLCEKYRLKYLKLDIKVSTMDELMQYMSNIVNFMHGEFNDVADEAMNVLTQFQIFDKSITEILSHCKSINLFHRQMQTYSDELKAVFEDIERTKRENAYDAASSVEGYYLNVWSTSSWDVLAADLINDHEERRVKKQQQKTFDRAMKIQDRMVNNMFNKEADNLRKDIYNTICKYGTDVIKEVFDYCTSTLISQNRLSYGINEHLKKEKAENILANLQRIQDENIKKEQICASLVAYPFSEVVHFYIFDHTKDEFDEYVRLAKFLKMESTAIDNCLKKCPDLKNSDDKYVKLINKLDPNYIQSIELDGETIREIEYNASVNEVCAKKLFNKTYNETYNLFFFAGSMIGKVKEQDRLNGHILIDCPTSLRKSLNASKMDIRLYKQNANQTLVEVTTTCKNDGIGVFKSAENWNRLLHEEVERKLSLSSNSTNNESIQNTANNPSEEVSNTKVDNGTNTIDSNRLNTEVDDKNIDQTTNIFNTKTNQNTSMAVTSSDFTIKESIPFNVNYDKVFDEFAYESFLVGKIEKKDKENGHIIVKCPKNFFQMILQMCGPATIDIKVSKISEEEAVADITSSSRSKGTLAQPTFVWKNILLGKVKRRLN